MTKYNCLETIYKVKCCVLCGQYEWFCLCLQDKHISSIKNLTEIDKTKTIIAEENDKNTSIAEENDKNAVLSEKTFQKEVFENKTTEIPVCVQKTISKEIKAHPSVSQIICFSTEVCSSISSEKDYWVCNCGTQLKNNEECIYCRQC